MGADLEGKIALITGAASGFGALTAEKFLEEGVETLFVTDINETSLFQKVEELRLIGKGIVIPIKHDVTSEEDWQRVASQVTDECGKLDILINNAGIAHRATFAECTVDDWNQIMAVNQTGPFLGMKLCLDNLKRSGNASIVNISSAAGLTGYFAAPYTASKWAVRGMSKAAAMEFSEWGIRVNSVHPGFTWTPLTEKAKDFIESFSKVIALERVGNPEEIVNGIIFLASDKSSFMTGTELVLDGGLTAGGGLRMVVKENGIYPTNN